MAPLQPVSDTDSADPQCGPSGLEPATRWYLADPQPGSSGLEPTTLHDQIDPPPHPFSVTPMNCDEKPAEGGSTVILILFFTLVSSDPVKYIYLSNIYNKLECLFVVSSFKMLRLISGDNF